MAKIELVSKEENKLCFVVKGINTTFANTIRRTIQEVPVLAIDTVEFSKNDSALFDEVLAHRIGLVPLKTDKTFVLQDDCSCKGKGCAKCTAELILKAKGPCMVYSKELKSKAVDVVYPDMPLVILEKNQELELIAAAKLGKGKEHAKFTPGLIHYLQYPLFTIKSGDADNDYVNACPRKILGIKDNKIVVTDVLKCDLCEACVEACKKKGKDTISVKGSEEDFIFMIESWGQMSAKEIMEGIFEALDDNLKKFSKELEKEK